MNDSFTLIMFSYRRRGRGDDGVLVTGLNWCTVRDVECHQSISSESTRQGSRMGPNWTSSLGQGMTN